MLSKYGPGDSRPAGQRRKRENGGGADLGRGPTQLEVVGTACIRHRDDSLALGLHQERHMVHWVGDSSIVIDKYDVRHLLEDKREFMRRKSRGKFSDLTPEEKEFEVSLDAERYHDYEPEDGEYPWRRKEDEDEEEEKDRADEEAAPPGQRGFAAIAFNYDDEEKEEKGTEEQPTKAAGEGEEGEDEGENFRPWFIVPDDVLKPKKLKRHQVIASTVRHVKENPQLEVVLKLKQAGNAKFSFLDPEDPLNGYYLWLKANFEPSWEQPPPLGVAPRSLVPKGILVPPEVEKKAIDKLADFTIKHGKEFEELVRKKEEANPLFSFLMPHSPYHAYYLFVLEYFTAVKEGKPFPPPKVSPKQALFPLSPGSDRDGEEGTSKRSTSEDKGLNAVVEDVSPMSEEKPGQPGDIDASEVDTLLEVKEPSQKENERESKEGLRLSRLEKAKLLAEKFRAAAVNKEEEGVSNAIELGKDAASSTRDSNSKFRMRSSSRSRSPSPMYRRRKQDSRSRSRSSTRHRGRRWTRSSSTSEETHRRRRDRPRHSRQRSRSRSRKYSPRRNSSRGRR